MQFSDLPGPSADIDEPKDNKGKMITAIISGTEMRKKV